jgi:hypothetical protein
VASGRRCPRRVCAGTWRTIGGSVDELAWAIDAYEQLGFDDLIIQLEPKTARSLDRLAEALELRTR